MSGANPWRNAGTRLAVWLAALALAGLVGAQPEADPPRIVATSPARGATEVEPGHDARDHGDL